MFFHSSQFSLFMLRSDKTIQCRNIQQDRSRMGQKHSRSFKQLFFIISKKKQCCIFQLHKGKGGELGRVIIFVPTLEIPCGFVLGPILFETELHQSVVPNQKKYCLTISFDHNNGQDFIRDLKQCSIFAQNVSFSLK